MAVSNLELFSISSSSSRINVSINSLDGFWSVTSYVLWVCVYLCVCLYVMYMCICVVCFTIEHCNHCWFCWNTFINAVTIKRSESKIKSPCSILWHFRFLNWWLTTKHPTYFGAVRNLNILLLPLKLFYYC